MPQSWMGLHKDGVTGKKQPNKQAKNHWILKDSPSSPKTLAIPFRLALHRPGRVKDKPQPGYQPPLPPQPAKANQLPILLIFSQGCVCVYVCVCGAVGEHDPLWNLSPKSRQFRSNNKQVKITLYLKKHIYGFLFIQLTAEEPGCEACREFSREVDCSQLKKMSRKDSLCPTCPL